MATLNTCWRGGLRLFLKRKGPNKKNHKKGNSSIKGGAPVHKMQIFAIRGVGGNNRIFAFWGGILVPAAAFLAFLEGFAFVFYVFL